MTVTSNANGPGGNVYDKYGSRNPVVRALMAGFFRDLDALLARAAPRTVIEAGCGEGVLSARLAPALDSLHAFDIDAACVAAARVRLESFPATRAVFQGDLTGPLPDLPAADLVLCCEVLEHVADPNAALRRLGTPDPAPYHRQRAARTALARAQHGPPQIPAPPWQHTPVTFSTGRRKAFAPW